MRGPWLLGAMSVWLATAAAHADIYLYRDRLGVLHFTNAPAQGSNDGPTQLLLKEKPLPPGPRILVVGRGWVSMGPPSTPGPGGSLTTTPSTTPFDALIREIAERFGVEYATVKAVIKAESAFNHTAVSRKGALGLMQLMPATAQEHQVQDVFAPRENIEGGVRHLRMLLDRYGGNVTLALAAYNAGTARVEKSGGVPPIPETQDYVQRVLRYRADYLAREGAGVVAARR